MWARISKYKLGARASKYKLGPRAGKYKFGARTGKYKFRARAGKHKLRTRAEGWGREPELGQRIWGREIQTPKKGFFFLVTVIRMSKRF